MPGEPKVITIRPNLDTELLEFGVEVLDWKKFPRRLEAISRELARRKADELRAANERRAA